MAKYNRVNKDKDKKPKKDSNGGQKSQQLSDRLANKVGKNGMTYEKAIGIQRKRDSIVRLTTKVGRKTRSSSAALPSKRKYTKAKYKKDNKGNLKAY